MCWRSRLWRLVRRKVARVRGQGCPRPTIPGGTRMSCLRWCGGLIRIANLKRETFDSILEMLSEGIAARRGRYGAYVHRDRVNGKLRARRGARLAAITSGGAIPDNSLVYGGRRAGRRGGGNGG